MLWLYALLYAFRGPSALRVCLMFNTQPHIRGEGSVRKLSHTKRQPGSVVVQLCYCERMQTHRRRIWEQNTLNMQKALRSSSSSSDAYKINVILSVLNIFESAPRKTIICTHAAFVPRDAQQREPASKRLRSHTSNKRSSHSA